MENKTYTFWIISYAAPFDRYRTYGKPLVVDASGKIMKQVMTLGSDRLTLVKKPWQEFVERTKGPLGRKFERYASGLLEVISIFLYLLDYLIKA